MINFFRKIRKNLADDNQFLKYSRYAIGEILLVVIGILFALQINNWNEEKKLRKSERILLTGILESLESDLGRTKFIYERRAQRKNTAIANLINGLNQENLPHDSILRRDYWRMGMTLTFTYDKGAYESLKSHGLEIIQSDSLRQMVLRLYENDLPLGVKFIDGNRDVESGMRKKLHFELTEFEYVQMDNGQWDSAITIDFRKIKDTKPLKNLIQLEKGVASNYIRRLEQNMLNFEEAIIQIHKELTRWNEQY